MNNLSYYDYIASKPCAGGVGHDKVQVHHIRGMASMKVRDTIPRSHKTLARFAAIPLCPECYAQVHRMGESKFFISRGHPDYWAMSLAMRYLAEYVDYNNRVRAFRQLR